MPTRHTPEIELPPDAATADDHRNPRRRRREAEEAATDLGMIVQPEPRHSLENLVLHPEVKTDILAALRALETRFGAALVEVEGLKADMEELKQALKETNAQLREVAALLRQANGKDK